MKTWITILIMALSMQQASAQSTWFNEWFRQKNTQTKYLMNQIAALEVYIGYAQKGYNIYKTGLNTIGQITHGEFSLHNDFFLSLKGINPHIAKYARVADIINLQLKTIQVNKGTLQTIRQGSSIQEQELAYVQRVFFKLLDNCAQIVDELIGLTTTGKLQLEDDQRLQRIDDLYSDMLDNYEFATDFSNGVIGLKKAREKEKRDIAASRSLYETK